MEGRQGRGAVSDLLQDHRGLKKLATTTRTSYLAAKAKSGVRYTFTVRCVSANGKTYTSGYDAAGRTVMPMTTPKVKAANAADCIKITWNRIAGADAYRVYFKAKGSGGWNVLEDVKTTNYYWSGGVLGMSYAFTVRAVDTRSGSLSPYKGSGYLRYAPEVASATDT